MELNKQDKKAMDTIFEVSAIIDSYDWWALDLFYFLEDIYDQDLEPSFRLGSAYKEIEEKCIVGKHDKSSFLLDWLMECASDIKKDFEEAGISEDDYCDDNGDPYDSIDLDTNKPNELAMKIINIIKKYTFTGYVNELCSPLLECKVGD